VGKTTVIYVNFLRDVACQKLLKSANVSRNYSKNNTGTVSFETVYLSLTLTDHYYIKKSASILSCHFLQMFYAYSSSNCSFPSINIRRLNYHIFEKVLNFYTCLLFASFTTKHNQE